MVRVAAMLIGAALAGALAITAPAAAGDIDPGVASAFGGWGISAPSAGRVIFCHGYGCNFRTEIGISAADHARLAALMAPGRAWAEAERRALAQTEAWFEKRTAPEAGTAHAKARASVGWGIGGD